MTVADDQAEEINLEAGRKLFAGVCEFVLGVAALSQLPPADRPEIAFAGRSNVGKSSLINALTGRKALARTSHTPGRTQQLNYFNLGKDALYLVDMPGYGYAKVSKTQREEWTSLIRSYLRGRPTLRCVFILIDSRHGLKETDIDLMKMLDETAVSYRIILTKSDKVKNAQRQAILDDVTMTLKKHPAGHPCLSNTSAHNGYGIPELRGLMAGYSELDGSS